ncbi:hypothetical protein PGT21_007583 [Puccinia graminis f. sp. tritici]|uniref:Uncharacterized protein n=1 Tax=Puccinia graminis f. sp. tritici TaxID=56615 RepID=A0A5B0LJP8_PUCGR|nr:hypothetical protein PGT21_007583 [Puccinia graminis f. sp. tritici]
MNHSTISEGQATTLAISRTSTTSQGQATTPTISQGPAPNPNSTVTQHPTHNHHFAANNEDEDGLRGTMGDDHNVDDASFRKSQMKLSDSQMEPFATMDLAALTAASKSYSTRRRMTDDMKEEVDEMYYEFQCNIAKLSIQNRVGAHLYFDHVGQSRRVRAGTSWNNFQKYDPEAQKMFDEFGLDAGRSKVSAIWARKTWPEKLRYRDVDYLKTLREVTANSGESNVPHPGTVLHAPTGSSPTRLNGRVQLSKVSLEKTSSLVANWVTKIQSDLDSFAFFHQVEGFYVIASRHPKSTIFHKGGSSVGNKFLRMLAQNKETDPAADFHTWTAAQAIQLSNGCGTTLHLQSRIKTVDDVAEKFRAGKHADNIKAIRDKLRHLIYVASGHKLNAPWPGEDTDYRLRELKFSFAIDDNQWNIEPNDLKKPLVKLNCGTAMGILACLGLNKIHLTYHPDWEDISPRPRKKQTNTNKRKNKRNREGEEDEDEDEDEEEDNEDNNNNNNPSNRPQRKRTRTDATTNSSTTDNRSESGNQPQNHPDRNDGATNSSTTLNKKKRFRPIKTASKTLSATTADTNQLESNKGNPADSNRADVPGQGNPPGDAAFGEGGTNASTTPDNDPTLDPLLAALGLSGAYLH